MSRYNSRYTLFSHPEINRLYQPREFYVPILRRFMDDIKQYLDKKELKTPAELIERADAQLNLLFENFNPANPEFLKQIKDNPIYLALTLASYDNMPTTAIHPESGNKEIGEPNDIVFLLAENHYKLKAQFGDIEQIKAFVNQPGLEEKFATRLKESFSLYQSMIDPAFSKEVFTYSV